MFCFTEQESRKELDSMFTYHLLPINGLLPALKPWRKKTSGSITRERLEGVKKILHLTGKIGKEQKQNRVIYLDTELKRKISIQTFYIKDTSSPGLGKIVYAFPLFLQCLSLTVLKGFIPTTLSSSVFKVKLCSGWALISNLYIWR